jgi:GT2 family glycosyltransferase
LNWNGGDLTLRCLEHLSRLDWPVDELQVVVVDNDSTDGSVERIEQAFPDVEVRRNDHNGGFPANNLALSDLEGVRYVGLLNNDAFAEPGWLAPLVEALDDDPELGAVSSKLLLAPRFVDVRISSPTFVPGPGDRRELGVMVRDVLVDGVSVWADAHLGEGGWGQEQDRDGTFEWTSAQAVLRVPVDPDQPVPARVTVVLQAERRKEVRVTIGGTISLIDLDRRPMPVDLPLRGTPYDVLNNVGSIVYDDGAGADRGWLEVDRGQCDEPVDVFAWCGGSVLFRPAYLADVGLFDEDFFLYYEDTDLSWRGRLRGWRYRTAPASVARHVHAATSEEGSEVFAFHVERNRLLMLVKNAPAGMARQQVWRYLLVTASYTRRDVVAPLLRLRRPRLGVVRRRVRSLFGFVRLLPRMLVRRRRMRRRRVVSDAELAAEMVRR